MSVPTVNGTIGKNATSAVATGITVTLTAGAAIGDLVLVGLIFSASTASPVLSDSQGHTWNLVLSSSNFRMYATRVNKVLSIGDTISYTNSNNNNYAMLVIGISGCTQLNSTGDTDRSSVTGTSTTAAATSLSTLHLDDALFVFWVCMSTNALATDYSLGSVDSGYTKHDWQVCSGSGALPGIGFAYKTVAATTPMPTQHPIWTLNASRTWTASVEMFSGLTARGSVGKSTMSGYKGGVGLIAAAGLGGSGQRDQLSNLLLSVDGVPAGGIRSAV